MTQHIYLVEKLIHAVNKMNACAKKPRDYGTSDLLYQSEIHTLAAVCHHTGKNASELAMILGVTNGAITQVVSKLINKGLIEKYHLRGNQKEVYFRLTQKGEIAYAGHELCDELRFGDLLTYLSSLKKGELEIIEEFFEKLETGCDK
jgi:DNA-binding MarR family transcriptional regulator